MEKESIFLLRRQFFGHGSEDAGLPACEEGGEGVASVALGELVGEQLADISEEGGGVVVAEVTLGQSMGIVGRDADGEGGDLGETIINCGEGGGREGAELRTMHQQSYATQVHMHIITHFIITPISHLTATTAQYQSCTYSVHKFRVSLEQSMQCYVPREHSRMVALS